MIYWLILGAIILLFGAVAFRGAPYVPTHHKRVRQGLGLLKMESNDLLVDLGSGDGTVLKLAAKHGWRALGYELNPLLVLISWWRCWPQHTLVRIKLRDFWLTELPPDTKAVFVFLAGPYMARLAKKLELEMAERRRPLQVLSYGYEIPGYLPEAIADGFYLYLLKPGTKAPMPLQTGA